jgi:hypothetical protein
LRPWQRGIIPLSIVPGLAALLGGCPIYQTTDRDRFPCASDSDCFSKEPNCQPAFLPDGGDGNFCSACSTTDGGIEFDKCTVDSDCSCPHQCLTGPANETHCFKPCVDSSNCGNDQVCATLHDAVCVAKP